MDVVHCNTWGKNKLKNLFLLNYVCEDMTWMETVK